MKNKLVILAIAMATMAFGQIKFPAVSNHVELEQTIGLTKVEVEYHRPNTNNRVVFGNLVPYGQVWRTGANNNTVVEFDTNVIIEGKPLAKGKYSLYSIPNKDRWDILFYKTTDNWGNPNEWNENLIALNVSVKPIALKEKVESFDINFENVTTDGAVLTIKWDTTKVEVQILTPTHQIVMESIKNQLNAQSSSRDFYNAANYYFLKNEDIKKAQEWINKAIKTDVKAPSYYFDLKKAIDAKNK